MKIIEAPDFPQKKKAAARDEPIYVNGESAEPDEGAPDEGAPGSEARAKRKMAFEWFNDAADSALIEPSDPLIEDMLDQGALSVIYGDSRSGKSFCALDLAFHVSIGALWNNKRVKHGLIMYVAAEGGRRIKRRLAALKKCSA